MSQVGGGRASALACLLTLALAACTEQTGRSAGPAQEPAARSVPAPTPAAQHQQPLVVIGHGTRPRPRLSRARARRLIAGHDPSARPGVVLRRVLRNPGALGVLPMEHVDARVRTALVAGVDPLRDPDEYPFQVGAREAPRRPVTMTMAGDVMLTRGVADPVRALAPLSARLARADLTVANLESTLSRAGQPTQGGDSFGADPSVVRVLEKAGIDAVSLANNHTGDHGPTALRETVAELRSSAIRPFGAGRNRAEAATPAVLERGGVRFGFLGFNAIGETPAATRSTAGALSVRMPPRTGPLVRRDLDLVLRAVRRLERRVDVVVVLPHWGTQYTHRAEPVQEQVGRLLIEAGAELVVGGHPHWVQGVEWHRGAVLAHSLGNFVFDMDFMTQTQQGVLLEAVFWGGELKAFDLLPYRMDDAFAPRAASPVEGAQILEDVWQASTGPFALR